MTSLCEPVALAIMPPECAAHVLHHFRATEGYAPGSFVQSLIETFALADPANEARLMKAFPLYGMGVHLAQNHPPRTGHAPSNRNEGERMSTDVAVQAPTDLAIRSDQKGFDDRQIAMLRQLGVEDASEGDIDLFFHRCRVTGLDPFSKQIYMIGRRTKIKVWNDQTRKQDEQWVMKFTIQTGIDGYRLNGKRAARKHGDKVVLGDPMWRGKDGGWDDVWLDEKNPPLAARFTITVNGDEKFTATVMYAEYVQTTPFNGEPNSMWKKMPANQLRKCAEAAAWRMAYPDDFANLVLEDAAQVIDEEGNRVTVESERVGNGSKNVRAAMGIDKAKKPPIDITDTHTEAEKEPLKRTTERTKNNPTSAKPQASASNSAAKVDSSTDPGDAPATSGQISALGKLFNKEGYADWPAQLQWLQGNGIVHGEISGLGDLNGAQAAVGIEALQ